MFFHRLTIRKFSALLVGTVLIVSAAASGFSAAASVEPEESVKKSIYALSYDQFMTSDWYKIESLTSALTRKDAAYLLVQTYASMTGSAIETIDYATKITDSSDVMMRRAYDMGLMSLDGNKKINPTGVVSQEEFSVLLVKLAQKLKVYKASKTVLAYTDNGKIATWAKPSVQYLTDKKVYRFIANKTLEPKKIITKQRALSMIERFMVSTGYASEIKTEVYSRKVGGFKVPAVEKAVMDFYVNKQGRFTIFFTGIMPFSSNMDYKSAMCQVAEVLDSNAEVTTNAVHSALEQMSKHFNPDNRSFKFDEALYIDAKTGAVASEQPSGAHLKFYADNILNIEFVK